MSGTNEYVKLSEQALSESGGSKGMYTHSGLENGHSYDYVLRYRVADYGWSDYSAPITGMAGGTIEGECWRKSAPCMRVTPGLATIELAWGVLPEEGRIYREYRVSWKRADDASAEQTIGMLNWHSPPLEEHYTITGLEQNTRYLVRVSAFSCNGQDPQASDACAAPGQEGPGIWHGGSEILVTTKADLSGLP